MVNSVLKMNKTVSSTHKYLKSSDVKVRHHSSNGKSRVHGNNHAQEQYYTAVHKLNMSLWSFSSAHHYFSDQSGK
jgi:hypothetical protein